MFLDCPFILYFLFPFFRSSLYPNDILLPIPTTPYSWTISTLNAIFVCLNRIINMTRPIVQTKLNGHICRETRWGGARCPGSCSVWRKLGKGRIWAQMDRREQFGSCTGWNDTAKHIVSTNSYIRQALLLLDSSSSIYLSWHRGFFLSFFLSVLVISFILSLHILFFFLLRHFFLSFFLSFGVGYFLPSFIK